MIATAPKITALLDRLDLDWTNCDQVDRIAPMVAMEAMRFTGAAGFNSAAWCLLEVSMREARALERLIGRPLPKLDLAWWVATARWRMREVAPFDNSRRWVGFDAAFDDVVGAWIDSTGGALK